MSVCLLMDVLMHLQDVAIVFVGIRSQELFSNEVSQVRKKEGRKYI